MTTPQDVVTKTLPARMAEQLRRDIISKEIAPGSHITAKEIAELWHTSQVPVREAFSILAGEGLIEINAYRGVTVLELSEERINEINDIVGALEVLLCRMCIQKGVSPELIEALTNINNELEVLTKKINDDNQLAIERVSLNMEFHRTMYSSMKGTETYRLYERYVNHLEAIRHVYAMPTKRVIETVQEHYQLIDALKAGDADELVRLIRAHSVNSRVRFGLYKGNVI